MKKVLIIMLCVFVCVVSFGCSSDENAVQEPQKIEQAAKESEPEAPAPAPEKPEPPKEIIASVGESLSFDNGLSIGVIDTKVCEYKINSFNELQEAYVLEIDVVVENNTSEELLVMDNDFDLYDQEGFQLNDILVKHDSLHGSVPSGKKVRGKLFFDVPEQEGEFELQYEETFTLDNNVPMKWKLPNGKQEEHLVIENSQFKPSDIVIENIGGLNDTKDLDGYKVTILGTSKCTKKVNQFSPLKKEEVLQVDVIFENSNNEEYFLTDSDFVLFDENGFMLEKALVTGSNDISGEIAGGKKAKGSLYFDVPKQEGDFHLYYSQTLSLSDKDLIWSIPSAK